MKKKDKVIPTAVGYAFTRSVAANAICQLVRKFPTTRSEEEREEEEEREVYLRIIFILFAQMYVYKCQRRGARSKWLPAQNPRKGR